MALRKYTIASLYDLNYIVIHVIKVKQYLIKIGGNN